MIHGIIFLNGSRELGLRFKKKTAKAFNQCILDFAHLYYGWFYYDFLHLKTELRLWTWHGRISFYPVSQNVFPLNLEYRIPTWAKSSLILDHKSSHSNWYCYFVRWHVSFRICPYNCADFVANADLLVPVSIPHHWMASHFY